MDSLSNLVTFNSAPENYSSASSFVVRHGSGDATFEYNHFVPSYSSLDFLQPDQQLRVEEASVRNLQAQIATSIRVDNASLANEYVTELFNKNLPLNVKFLTLNLKELLMKNAGNNDCLHIIVEGLLILQKYGKNLLHPPTERPTFWKIINFTSPMIGSMKGFTSVLSDFGYTVKTSNGLEFPSNEQPDMHSIALIMADIALGIKELESYLKGTHPAPGYIDECIRPESRVSQHLQSNINHSRDDLCNLNIQPNPTLSQSSSSSQCYFPVNNFGTSELVSRHPSSYVMRVIDDNEGFNQDAKLKTVNQIQIPNFDNLCDVCGINEWIWICDHCIKNNYMCDNCCSILHRHIRRGDHNVKKQSSEPCYVCGANVSHWSCSTCNNQTFCDNCNATWHNKNPARSIHEVKLYNRRRLLAELQSAKMEMEGVSASSEKKSQPFIATVVDRQWLSGVEQVPDIGASGPLLYMQENFSPVQEHLDSAGEALVFGYGRTGASEYNLRQSAISSSTVEKNAELSKSNNLAIKQSSHFDDYATGRLPSDLKPRPISVNPSGHFMHANSYPQMHEDTKDNTDGKESIIQKINKKLFGSDRQLKSSRQTLQHNCKNLNDVYSDNDENESFEFVECCYSVEQKAPLQMSASITDQTPKDECANAFSEELLHKESKKKRFLQMEDDGRSLVQSIRKLELQNFHVDEALFARSLSTEGKMVPWLQNEWLQLQQTARKKVRDQLMEGEMLLEPSELKAVLISASGNDENMLSTATAVVSQKIEALSDSLWCTKAVAADALCVHSGSLIEATKSLHETNVAEFCARWASDVKDEDKSLSAKCVVVEELLQRLGEDRQRKVRLLLMELELSCWADGECVMTLCECFPDRSLVTMTDIIDAQRTCTSLAEMQAFLQWECAMCYGQFPAGRFLKLAMCECRICRECMQQYFNVQIREHHVTKWSCPLCANPDIGDSSDTAVHLQFLDEMLKPILSSELHELFEKKLRDWHLMSDPNFRWCQGGGAGCGSGSIYHVEPNQPRIVCQDCSKSMCFFCKKPWENQHKNLSCDAFAQWKHDNDSEHQEKALANYLEENGIDCPRCKFRFALAKGGCMHFKCNRCTYEFCCGCNEPFRHGSTCKKFAACASKGLHCHHPRDCLYFMRDMDIKLLCELLQMNKIAFDRGQQSVSSVSCSVMEQKESGTAMIDEACGREVVQNCGGLCEMHYKEYLVALINKHGIDPVSVLNIEDMEIELQRNYKALPVTRTNSERQQALRTLIEKELPLQRINSNKRVVI